VHNRQHGTACHIQLCLLRCIDDARRLRRVLCAPYTLNALSATRSHCRCGRAACCMLHAVCCTYVRHDTSLLPQSPPPAPRSSVRGGTGYCRVPSSLAASSRLRPLLLRVHCCGRSFHEPLAPCGASCCLSCAVCHVARHASRMVDVVAMHFMNSLRSLGLVKHEVACGCRVMRATRASRTMSSTCLARAVRLRHQEAPRRIV
jgi:hypothetical protein